MTYEQQKLNAIRLIDIFIAKNKFSAEDIAYFVLKQTGFGEKFTLKYINDSLERGFIIKNKNGAIITPGDDKHEPIKKNKTSTTKKI